MKHHEASQTVRPYGRLKLAGGGARSSLQVLRILDGKPLLDDLLVVVGELAFKTIVRCSQSRCFAASIHLVDKGRGLKRVEIVHRFMDYSQSVFRGMKLPAVSPAVDF